MTFDDETDAYDPIIAERFKLLDRATPSAAPLAGRAEADSRAMSGHGADAAAMAATPLFDRGHGDADGRPFRPLQLMAAAAAAVVAIGGVVLAVGSLSDDPSLQAGDQATELGAPEQAETDGATAENDGVGGQPLTVEVSSTTTPEPLLDDERSGADAAASANAEADEAGNPDQSTTQPENNPTETEVTDDGSAQTEATVQTTTGPPTTAAEPTTTIETTTTTEPTTTTEQTSTTELTPNSSWLNPPTADKMISVRGTVTEVFTDCQSRLILNEANQVESVGPVSCDGGSYIIVDGRRIQTASGYVMNEADVFGKHIVALRPGQRVSVTAVYTASAGGMLTLNCVLCEINVGG
jgi:hypothetical protein